MPGHTSMIRRDPIGIVGSIAPWNYPLMMMAWKLAPAIAGGNTVVFKPSEQTPLTALKLGRLLADILPEGVVNIVLGQGGSVGNALINHPGIDMISITGDIATGKKVLQAAARSVKRTHLELGGKAPVIVYDDADLSAVVEGLRAFGFYNAGQDCTAACRIYAGPKIYDKLVADLSGAVSTIRLAGADDTQNEIGPLISRRQRDRVSSFVERAAELPHVEITTGGRTIGDKGFFYQPTVVAGALQSDEIVRRESSAPWSPSRASPTTRRPSPGPTIPTTGSPRPSGPRTSPRRWRPPRPFATLHLDQHAFHAGQRDAAWRPEAVGLRQGPVELRARGLHGVRHVMIAHG